MAHTPDWIVQLAQRCVHNLAVCKRGALSGALHVVNICPMCLVKTGLFASE